MLVSCKISNLICQFCCLEYWSFPGDLQFLAWKRKWSLHMVLLPEFQIQLLLELMSWTLVLRVELTCFWFSFCCFCCFQSCLLVFWYLSHAGCYWNSFNSCLQVPSYSSCHLSITSLEKDNLWLC